MKLSLRVSVPSLHSPSGRMSKFLQAPTFFLPRQIIGMFTVTAWAYLLIASSQHSVDASPAQPNILLIISEDNGPELGCYGEPYVKTPHLDRLASRSVRFDRAYVPQAGCSQSRAAYLTGLYPHQNGQIGLATWKFRMYSEQTPNLVRSLKDVGYRTGIIGKLHVNPKSAFPFDFKKITTSNFARKKLKAYAAEAREFITQSEKPFFLSVNYPDPHRPFTKKVGGLPKKPLEPDEVKPFAYFGEGVDTPNLREQVANYYNCMSRLDSLVGDLLKVLQQSGKADNTLIIYFGDHGADLLRGKRTSYEGGVRVPLIIKWADRWQAVRNELVSTLDLMPTLLEVTGADPVPNLAGHSLIPLLDGQAKNWRTHLFTEFHTHSGHNYYPQRTVRDDRFKLIQNLMPNEVNPGYDFTINRFFAGLQEAIDASPVSDAYALMRKPPAFELYDLKNDPYEFRNLAANPGHVKTLNDLQARLLKWRQDTKDPMLDSKNVQRLRREIQASFKDGKPEKDRLTLTYPDYFFE